MLPFQCVNAGAVSAADTVIGTDIVIGAVNLCGTTAHAKSNGNAEQNEANRCQP
jgi:hypothetical protein